MAIGCVTAKLTETEAGSEDFWQRPPQRVVLAPAVVAAVAKPDDWCTRYPDAFECADVAAAAATTSDDWCARYPDFVCQEAAPVPGLPRTLSRLGIIYGEFRLSPKSTATLTNGRCSSSETEERLKTRT